MSLVGCQSVIERTHARRAVGIKAEARHCHIQHRRPEGAEQHGRQNTSLPQALFDA